MKHPLLLSLTLSTFSCVAMNLPDKEKKEIHTDKHVTFLLKESTSYAITSNTICDIATIPHRKVFATAEVNGQENLIHLWKTGNNVVQNKLVFKKGTLKKVACTESTLAVLRNTDGNTYIELFELDNDNNMRTKGSILSINRIRGFCWNTEGTKLGCKDEYLKTFFSIANYPLNEQVILIDEMRIDQKSSGGTGNIAWSKDGELLDVYHTMLSINVAKINKNNVCVCTEDESASIVFFDLTTKNTLIARSVNSGVINAIAFDSTGQYLASGDRNGNVVVWDANDQKTVAQINTAAPITALSWSNDDEEIIVGMNKYPSELNKNNGLIGYTLMKLSHK